MGHFFTIYSFVGALFFASMGWLERPKMSDRWSEDTKLKLQIFFRILAAVMFILGMIGVCFRLG